MGRLKWGGALSFLGKQVMWGVEVKGQSIHWGGSGLGVVFLDFHPSSTFPRGGGIFVLIYPWWEVSWPWCIMGTSDLQGPLFVMQCKHIIQQVTLGHWRFPPFPTFLCLPPGPWSPQNVWFPVSLEVPAFLCLPKDPCCLQDVWFPAIWPVSPFSPHI